MNKLRLLRAKGHEAQQTPDTLTLDDVLLAGAELEFKPTRTRFKVECIAESLVTKGEFHVVVYRRLGLDVSYYVVSYEMLKDGNWSNLGFG